MRDFFSTFDFLEILFLKTILQIKKPCAENWDNMTPVSDGKFCASCSKKVLDLSNHTDKEILELLNQKNGASFCGKLYRHQLNRSISDEEETSSEPLFKIPNVGIAAGIAMSISLVGITPAQQITAKPSIETTVQQKKQKNEGISKNENTENPTVILSGKIIDVRSKRPLSGVTVNFISISKIYFSRTDASGNYQIEIPKMLLKPENLIHIQTEADYPNEILKRFSNNEILRKDIVIPVEITSGHEMEYGVISPMFAGKNSLVFFEGQKIENRLFNKSFMLYERKYIVYYIPKEFADIFTDDSSVEEIMITFLNKKM